VASCRLLHATCWRSRADGTAACCAPTLCNQPPRSRTLLAATSK
jgi:hypothetical protein